MTANVPERQVRISRIAGRYLVFDIDDVVYIRRYHGVCAVLTGTMPQNPTQNLFLGLPVELRAEEAKLLVDKNVGYIADELSDHLSQLTSMDASTRKTYLQRLKQQRRIAQRAFDEEKARVQAKHRSKRKAANADKPAAPAPKEEGPPAAVEDETPSLFEAQPTNNKSGPAKNKGKPKETLPAITPTTSSALLPPPSPRHPSSATEAPAPECASYPLYRYLNSRGYYTTPGLRFGGDLSVYPGDPFRYHAHYLANGYGWDEPVPMLDLVTSGRLGTAVKKSFLFGAEQPAGHGAAASASDENDNTVGEKSGGGGGGEVRVFCIEWAGM